MQNSNADEEGLTPAWQAFRDLWKGRSEATEAPIRGFLVRDTSIFFYTAGVRDRQNINPDNWNLDQYFLDQPNNAAAQLELFYNYRANLDQYPHWHEAISRARQTGTSMAEAESSNIPPSSKIAPTE